MLTIRDTSVKTQNQRPGEFFNKLSPAALRDLESMEFPTQYQPGQLLFSEKGIPSGIFILLSGEVKLSINSSEGKRLILSIAKAGEVLGLSSVLSGLPSEMTAEILHPSRIAVIERDQFIGFMARHPEVYQIVTQELSLQYKVACEQLRTVALSGSAPEKLARLLLEWSENGQKTEAGTRFVFFAYPRRDWRVSRGLTRNSNPHAFNLQELRSPVARFGVTSVIWRTRRAPESGSQGRSTKQAYRYRARCNRQCAESLLLPRL